MHKIKNRFPIVRDEKEPFDELFQKAYDDIKLSQESTEEEEFYYEPILMERSILEEKEAF